MKKIFFTLFLLIGNYFFIFSQTTIYQKTFGALHQDYGFDLIPTTDGGYAMTGYSNSDSTDFNVLLIKLDSNADVQWSMQYGGTGNDQALQLVQTSDGRYAIAG